MRGRRRGNMVLGVLLIILIINIVWFGILLFLYLHSGNSNSSKKNAAKDVNQSSSLYEFYRSKLSEGEQAEYEILYSALTGRQETIEIHKVDTERMSVLWQAVLYDHPEIFWADSYQYIEYKDADPYLEIRPSYLYTSDEIKKRQDQIEVTVQTLINSIDPKASTYEKVLAVYEYIIKNTDYEEGSKNNQHVDSVLVSKQSVCMGYAKTTKLLLESLGINSVVVVGKSKEDAVDGPNTHAWNIVEGDGAYFHVDTTWGDPTFDHNTQTEANVGPDYVSYGYLGCNDDQIFKNHVIDTSYGYPACSSLEYNYHVVNKRYYEEYDQDALVKALKEDIKEEKDQATFRFATEEGYKTAIVNLSEIYSTAGGTSESVFYSPIDEIQVINIDLK